MDSISFSFAILVIIWILKQYTQRFSYLKGYVLGELEEIGLNCQIDMDMFTFGNYHQSSHIFSEYESM